MPANRTYVIGLTGGMGCGKTEAAGFLASLGAEHIDTDGISRALTMPGGAAIPAIRDAFGDAYIDENGSLKRKEMADLVFHDPMLKRKLEGILHPLIQRAVMNRIDDATKRGVPVTVLDVPLLFESGMDVLCDETWTMSADPSVQMERVRVRDGLSEDRVRARLASQMSMEERNALATKVIDSERPIEKTRAELEQLYKALLKRI